MTAPQLSRFPTRFAAPAALLLLSLHMTSIAHAADASNWDKGVNSAVRLIAGDPIRKGDQPRLRAGIEILLDAGWKTYWRYPGDSGVPPRFDFAGSQNVKAVTVRWPAPHRFSDDGGQSIGYKDRIVLPLTIVPSDASKPVTLRLALDYAICAKLCVPADAKAELILTGGQSAHEAALAAAEARVPKAVPVGDRAAFAIVNVKQETPQRVVVDVAAPQNGEVDLFAEGPTPDWALPLPEPVAGAPAGHRRFSFAIDGVPPGVSPAGALLTFTAVAGDQAVESTYRLSESKAR